VTEYLVPGPLSDEHRLDGFACGTESLDRWLVERARANMRTGASRTFVVTDGSSDVVAYYALSTGSVSRTATPRTHRHGAPQPVPVLLIGRFAVATAHQGAGLGHSLLQDALTRCARLSIHAGFMFVLVHPVDDAAETFWRRFGFIAAPTEERVLLLPTSHLSPPADP